ncbi:sterol esterase [Mycena olivaceomarginata]|nr:sterol esterase [Mycena olivaceomarginata]
MISLLFLPLYLLLRPDPTAADSPTVALAYGTFRGFARGNVTQFLGVPFGQAARFEVPQEPALLHGLQNATSFGPACPQQALDIPSGFPVASNSYPSISEDCLTLDVFTPTVENPEVKLPVFVVGNKPIIVVTPNYRVSAFGFLAGKEAGAAGISNLGLRDQIFALKWVQKHISAFGGDPARVVVGGVSAGSISTSFLFLNNKQNSNTLFRGAFLQSGPAIHVPQLSDGQSDYDGLVAANNCSAAGNTLDCLRHAPFDTFMASVNNTRNFLSYRSLNIAWGPRIDGDVVQRDPWVSLSGGLYAKVPVLAGMCDDEGTLLRTDGEFLDYVHFNYLPETSQDNMAQLARLYPDDPTQGSPFDTGTDNQLTPEYKRLAAFQGDLVITSPRRFLLEKISSTQDAWGWLNKMGKSAKGPLGASHASDTPIWFTLAVPEGIDSLLNFINTLDPNRPAKDSTSNVSIPWPKWNTPSAAGASSLLTFWDTGINVTADEFRSEAVGFLNDLRLSEVQLY